MKKVLILAAMLLGLSAGVQAQTDNDDEDEDDEKNLEKVYGVTPGIDFPITLHKRIE